MRAVVSGLGPNGVAASLELLNRGFQVTVVEKRPGYGRKRDMTLARLRPEGAA